MKLMKINSFTTVAKKQYVYWGQGQNASNVFEAVSRELASSHLPIVSEVQDVSLGISKGKREYLVIAGPHPDLLIGISAQPYGDFLCVFAYLAMSPNVSILLKGTLGIMAGVPASQAHTGGLAMNISDIQDMNMFWACTINCMEKALESIGLKEQMKGFSDAI